MQGQLGQVGVVFHRTKLCHMLPRRFLVCLHGDGFGRAASDLQLLAHATLRLKLLQDRPVRAMPQV